MFSKQMGKRQAASSWSGVVGHLLLAAAKGGLGMLAFSKALLADAAHSAGSAIELAGTLIRGEQGDRSEGSRARDEAANPAQTGTGAVVIASVLLMVIGVEFGLSALRQMSNGVEEAPHYFALIAVSISVIIQELLFRYRHRVIAEKLAEQPLHMRWYRRYDLYPALLAFVGVGGAVIGSWFELKPLYYLDPIAGFVIAMIVIYMGFRMIMQRVFPKAARPLYQEDIEELTETVQRIKGVITVDELVAREVGHYVMVEVTISVNPRISMWEGHDIAKQVRYQLMKRFVHISEVVTAVTPYDPGYPYKQNVDVNMDEISSLLH